MPYRVVATPAGAVELLLGESLVSAIAAPVNAPTHLPDPESELMRLTGVSRPDHIGTRRPVIAGTTLQGGSGDAHFRLFEALFGRDSLLSARMVQFDHPALMRTTLLELARQQGLPRPSAPNPLRYDNRDEAPGRIAHEIRDPRHDPRARWLTAREGMHWPMYRSDDATLLFAREVLAEVAREPLFLSRRITQRDGVQRTMGASLIAALRWAEQRCGPEGLLMSTRPTSRVAGTSPIAYPTWQDASDAVFREDGSLCTGAVAFIEMQGYLHDVLTGCAALARRNPAWARRHGIDPGEMQRRSDRLAATVVRTYFQRDPRGDYFAYGAERVGNQLIPLRVLKSTPGHLLDTGLLEGPQYQVEVDALVRSLLDPTQGLACASGIRTCSSREARFRPSAYHSGSVWAFDNRMIAAGLERHGYALTARWVNRTLRRTCEVLGHFPEFIRGDDSPIPRENQIIVHTRARDPHFGVWDNAAIQPAQPTQAWTVTAYIAAGHALLGAAISDARVRLVDSVIARGCERLQRGGPLVAAQDLAIGA